MMVLGTLNQGPLHGYAIARHIRNWSKGDLEVEDGSLYPALNRMLLKGWVTAEWGVTETNRGPQTWFQNRRSRIGYMKSQRKSGERIVPHLAAFGNRGIAEPGDNTRGKR